MRLKWYGHVMRREEHYVGRRAMELKVEGRRKRGGPKGRWLDKVKDDIEDMGMSADEEYDSATWGVCHRISTPQNLRCKGRKHICKLRRLSNPPSLFDI